jgi:hypothetical protein
VAAAVFHALGTICNMSRKQPTLQYMHSDGDVRCAGE